MVCPAQLAQPPHDYREMPARPGAPSFVQDDAIKAREKKQGSPGVRQPDICPGQPTHSDSANREVSVAPSGGFTARY